MKLAGSSPPRIPVTRTPHSTQAAGFTLLELMAAISIASLLIAYPLLNSRIAPNLLRTEARYLESAISAAKLRACRSGVPIELALDRSGFRLTTAAEAAPAAPSVFARHQFANGVYLESATFGSLTAREQTARFWPNATQSPGTIVISAAQNRVQESCSVTMALRGATRVRCF